MAKYFQIDIPKGCREEWSNMTSAENGKYCNACQKNVIDFTLMSDTQLAEFFKKKNNNVCGRFIPGQLNTNILIPSKGIPWLKYLFQITIPAFLLSLKGTAQTNPIKDDIHVVDVKKQATNEQMKFDNGKYIKGKIVDENGIPVGGVTIRIKGTKIGTLSDSAGIFKINIDPTQSLLQISAVGFSSQEINVANNPGNDIVLKLDRAIMGEVVVIGYAIRRKPKPAAPVINIEPIKLFPNPVSNCSKLSIQWQKKISADQIIEIYNLNGVLLQQEIIKIDKKSNEQSINLKQLIEGTYIIRTTDSKTHKSQSQQFIIQ